MKFISIIVLSLMAVLTVSCSRGGGDSSSPSPAGNDNGNKTAAELQTKFPNKAGTVFGMWTQDKKLNIYISENSARIEVNCQKKSASVDFAIQISGNNIKTLETKKAGDSECSVEVKKDDIFAFKVNGDQLTLSAAGESDLVLTRLQNAPVAQQPTTQPNSPQPSNPQPGNNNSGANTFELYSGANCTGTMVGYSTKMNCQTLAQAPAIQSAQFEGSCANLENAMPAEQVCQILNQQAGNN